MIVIVASGQYLKPMVTGRQPRLRDLGHGLLMATVRDYDVKKMIVLGGGQFQIYYCMERENMDIFVVIPFMRKKKKIRY